MSNWTIRLLKCVDPEDRLHWAARVFWWSVVLGILSVVFLCSGWFERVLMAISWLAVNITCIDIILTTDVRAKEEEHE